MWVGVVCGLAAAVRRVQGSPAGMLLAYGYYIYEAQEQEHISRLRSLYIYIDSLTALTAAPRTCIDIPESRVESLSAQHND